MTNKNKTKGRRDFLKSSFSMGAVPVVAAGLPKTTWADVFDNYSKPSSYVKTEKSVIGSYGPWASSLQGNAPRTMSFRNSKWGGDMKKWKEQSLPIVNNLVASPVLEGVPEVKVLKTYKYDGLSVEELEWDLGFGNPTKAILLKPEKAKGKLPAVLGLHDHGGNKYFGRRKITRTSDDQHPLMKYHQEHYYEGMAWANELAKRGYVVLVPDVFTFGSRRVLYQDVDFIGHGPCNVEGKSDENPETPEKIKEYNDWASEHEHIMAKSLFCGGTTWPGVFLAEDKKAIDVLCAREDVDKERVGCSGLSGGGIRTVYLGGLDNRIKCAVGVGFMTTWDDLLLYKSFTHTWMTYTPLLPNYIDFPEILTMRAPMPTMVLNNSEDQLFTLPEMQKAGKILKEVYEKAGATEKLAVNFYPGPHKFDKKMQSDAFGWFDKWLKG